MTASVSHKGKFGRVASMALATVLSTSFVVAAIAPASANDFYYDEQFAEQQVYPVASSQSVYRDETGRFFIRHGRKQYIQYWNRHSSRDPIVEPRRQRDKNLETAIIAGVAGLAIGAIIAGSQQPQRVIAQPLPRNRQLPRTAFPDAPSQYEPRVVTYEGAFEPWTQNWADWCSQRYRTFNINTGTYKSTSGANRFCVVK